MGEQYYRTAALECIARKVLTQYDQFYLNRQPQAVPLEKIIEDIFGLSIEYMRLTAAGDELWIHVKAQQGYPSVLHLLFQKLCSVPAVFA